MSPLVIYLLLFVLIGAGFLFVNLMIGRLLRPNQPNPEKDAIYECGEPTVGSSWIQFDLRFYVVALLFVIFDVEMAFFFPWATVYGNANQLANEATSIERQEEALNRLGAKPDGAIVPSEERRASAKRFAWIAFGDILFFFGVLLVGFAYLWKRGDLDWVRSTAAQDAPAGGAT